jgi:hypothetical protein
MGKFNSTPSLLKVFDNLPPPEPSSQSYSYGGYGGQARTAVASMSVYNNCYGGCFLPGCVVTLKDGTKRRCDMVRETV